ncbi:protein YIPF1 [Periophthalmus magnuspinnatus]|uniref:protein YIPF1 n=1 Tax=Periophthalmus magnuspinnatus TaxID=409849 RepID=UPI00145BA135|nr:protein YIPF1 [Periophthalmus magnuspinnatus]
MASMKDPFEFQDFDDSGNLLGPSRDAVTISIEDEDEVKFNSQKKTADPSVGAYEEDPVSSDDQTKLLSGQKKNAAFWTFEYYQQFFDIDTYHVKERILGSVLPWPRKNFIHTYLRRNPDLYGPFWICTTLVFAIAISGNISTFLVNLGNPNYKYTPEFRKVTIAATAIFSYAWLVPLALWGVLLWRSNKVTNLVSYSFMEIVCVYGYSLAVYIPAVIIWIVPFMWLQWLSIMIALCLSGSVLMITFWPAVRDDHPKVYIAILSTIVTFNVLLAVGCKMYFFSKPEELPQKFSGPTVGVKITSNHV